MRKLDYRSLPKLRDSLSHLYVEHAKIDKEARSISLHDKEGITQVPVAGLTLLMLGPGTSITHQAIRVLADSGCLVVWSGEEGIRYYAHGLGETRKGYKLERQARMWADDAAHMRVVRAMYGLRLGIRMDDTRTLQQLRGMEGVRVRDSYAQASRATGVPWHGRNYDRSNWSRSDDINRALSAANACLYGLCHAAIVSGGYSPGLGFIHSGKQLSFVYDVADFYKANTTIPLSFDVVKSGTQHLEREVRRTCRDVFREQKLLDRILPDIERVLCAGEQSNMEFEDGWEEDADPARPMNYWNPEDDHSDPMDTGFEPEGSDDGDDT